MEKALVGKNDIKNLLTTHNDPRAAIVEIQSRCGLKYQNCKPALSFLDMMQIKRVDIYQNLLACLKSKLDDQLITLPDSKLLILLKECFPYIMVPELRAIPVSIIKRLNFIPEKFLISLGDPKIRHVLNELPLSIRRQVWKMNPIIFSETIVELCYSASMLITTSPLDLKLRVDGPINQICDLIGSYETLFKAFADYCCKQFMSSFQDKDRGTTTNTTTTATPVPPVPSSWGTLLRFALLNLQEKGHKMKDYSKIHELASHIDQCIRQGRVDDSITVITLSILHSLISSLMMKHMHAQLLAQQQSFLKNKSSNKSKSINRTAYEQSQPKPGVINSSYSSSKSLNENDTTTTTTTTQMEVVTISSIDSIEREYSMPLAAKVKKEEIDQRSMEPSSPMEVEAQFDYHDVTTNNSATTAIAVAVSSPSALIDSVSSHSTIGAEEARKCSPPPSQPTPASENTTKADCIIPDHIPLSTSTSQSLDSSHPIASASSPPSIIPPNVASLPSITSHALVPPPSVTKSQSVKSPPPKTTTTTASPTTTASSPVGIQKEDLSTVLKEAWTMMNKLDKHNTFSKPVTDRIAPNYSKVISRPMDMSTIKNKISKSYTNIQSFESDLKLMFDNCVRYNGEMTLFGKTAKRLWGIWLAKRENYANKLKDKSVPEDSKESSVLNTTSTTSSRSSHLNGDSKSILLSSTSSVLTDNRNGYHNITSNSLPPTTTMTTKSSDKLLPPLPPPPPVTTDISQKPIPKKKKVLPPPPPTSPMTSSLPSSLSSPISLPPPTNSTSAATPPPITTTPATTTTTTTSMETDMIRNSISADCDTSSSAPTTTTNTANEEAASTTAMSLLETITPTEVSVPSPSPSVAAASSTEAPPTKELLMKVLEAAWDFISQCDQLRLFASPVTEFIAPNYFSEIPHPMDLSTIRLKISKSYHDFTSFESDLFLMFKNCVTYNGEGSEFAMIADTLSDIWKTRRQEFLDVLYSHSPLSSLPSHSRSKSVAAKNRKRQDTDPHRTQGQAQDRTSDRDDERRSSTASRHRSRELKRPLHVSDSEDSDSSHEPQRRSKQSKSSSGVAASRSSSLPPPPRITTSTATITQTLLTSASELTTATTTGPHEKQKAYEYHSSDILPAIDQVEGTAVAWAICMLRDMQMQSLLKKFLSSRIEYCYSEGKLPIDDHLLKQSLQLVQLGMDYRHNGIPGVDDTLLRVCFPLLLTRLSRGDSPSAIKVYFSEWHIIKEKTEESTDKISSEDKDSVTGDETPQNEASPRTPLNPQEIELLATVSQNILSTVRPSSTTLAPAITAMSLPGFS